MHTREIYDTAVARMAQAKQVIASRDFPIIAESLETLQDRLDVLATHPSLTRFCAFAEDVTGWIPLNPNDIHRIHAIISTYHLPEYDKSFLEQSTIDMPHPISSEYLGQRTNYEPGYKLPSKRGLLTLFDKIIQGHNQYIAVSGRRGSGKTLALNFFLTTAHKALCQKGVLWFRSDISKIWAYEPDFLTITQYTILHSIFVALHYAKDDQNLVALDNYGKHFNDYLDALPDNLNKNHRAIWNRLVSAYKNAIRNAKGSQYYKPVSLFLAEGKELFKEYSDYPIQSLFTELITFLRKIALDEGKTLRIVIILDGVDNIRVGAHQERYYKFLREINGLLNRTPIEIGNLFIIVARPETFYDISIQMTSMLHGQKVPAIFNIDIDFVRAVVERKADAIKNPVHYFQSKAELLTGKKFIEKGDSISFAKSVKSLFDRFDDVKKLVRSMPVINDASKPIDLLFDGNMRSLLRNIIRAHHHKLQLKHEKHTVPPVRSLLEGSILAGCTIMPKNFDENVHGHWCPNIFEDAILSNGHWTGLIVVRFIQLLDSVKDGLTRINAIKFIHDHFRYPLVNCEQAFQVASEFSLIRANGTKVDKFDTDIARPIHAPTFISTIKGRYILNLAFKDTAIFYFMATGTPLDLDRAKQLKIAIKNMMHSSKGDRHFFRAAILSGLVLWAHILTANRQELNRLIDRISLNDGSNRSISKSAFELPDNDLWFIVANDHLRKLSDDDLNIVSDAISKYIVN